MHSRSVTWLSFVLCFGSAALAFSQPLEEPTPTPSPLPAAAHSGSQLGRMVLSFGLQADHSSEEDFGIGGRLVVQPDKHVGLEFVGAFDYFFPKSESFGGIDESRSYFEASTMIMYKLRDPSDSFRPYLGVGLAFGHSRTSLHFNESWHGMPDETMSSTHTEWNGTAGALFGRGSAKLFVEARYTLEGYRTVVLSAGVRFGGGYKARRTITRPGRESAPGGLTPVEAQRAATQIDSGACPVADVGFRVATDKHSHPTPEPDPGKALVYVLRPAWVGLAIQTKVAVDGRWVGANKARNYFYVTLDPGVHTFCSKSENRSSLALRLEEGKTYFLEQKISMGALKARNKLILLDDAEGREKLAECHLSVSTPKE